MDVEVAKSARKIAKEEHYGLFSWHSSKKVKHKPGKDHTKTAKQGAEDGERGKKRVSRADHDLSGRVLKQLRNY